MSTRTTIITVFILGLIMGVLLTLMWIERNAPDDTESKQREWRQPMATKKAG